MASWALLAAPLLAFSAWGPALGAVQDDGLPDKNLFQLYDTQAARSKAAAADDHIANERWAEAVAELQTLIEDHAGEVLKGERPTAEGARLPSQQDVHPGAGTWAVGRLFSLPEEGRALYRRRYANRAELALERAIASGDRGALARIAQRWPITDAAHRAWWALGDLELELGHTADGLKAWARAAAVGLDQPKRRCTSLDEWKALAADVGKASDANALPDGAVARMDFALDVLSGPMEDNESSSSPRNEATFVLGPATGIAADAFGVRSSVLQPGGSAGVSGWPRPYELPRGPFKLDSGASRLFPQRFGDRVFVNTSRSLHALNAFDGSEEWVFGSDRLDWNGVRNWRDFEEAIDLEERIVTVAASRGIVVGALQIPVVYEDKDDYQDLSIINVIPERRLIACDVETGEVLWHTMPPKGWDGESGSFKDRMTVVGPPVAVGARVLVPMARLRGRIELYLGCLDLTDGSVLWSAPLVTGQRELNMFGRATREFSAPAPVVVGDSVIVQTQLGLIAAVDLFTGETLWDTLYEQVEVHAPQYYQEGWIDARWRNATPVVTGSTLVAAPQDSTDLLGIDLETGSVIWSLEQDDLMNRMGVPSNRRWRNGRGRIARTALIGADEQRVYLAGPTVVAVEFPRGVRQGPPFRRAWIWPEDRYLQTETAQPVMDAGSVFVPDTKRLVRLDRQTGRLEEQIDGAIASGNVLVSGGMLFATNGRRVDARFEWQAMVDRALRVVESEGATLDDVRTLSGLLLERAEGIVTNGREVRRGIDLADAARGWLERFGARTRPEAPATASSRVLEEDMHRALMVMARGHRAQASPDGAALARQALALATDGTRQLEALLVLQDEANGGAIDRGERAALLTQILRDHGDRPVELLARPQVDGWRAPDAYDEVRVARGKGAPTRGGDPWRDPWRFSPKPVLATLGASEEVRLDAERATVPAGVFVHVTRSLDARRGLVLENRLETELDALHDLLRESPDVPLFGTSSGRWATARIFAIRLLWPESGAIAGIERRAEAAFDAAMKGAADTGSTEDLELLPVLFPGSEASRRAADARIEFALEHGEPADVASIVAEALPRDWHPSTSSARDTEMLLRLAETLGNAGNRAFRAGVARSLAAFTPDTRVRRPASLPGSGELTLSELADAWSAREPEPPRPNPTTLDNAVVISNRFKGNYGPVGDAALEDGTPVLLMATAQELVALQSGAEGRPLWARRVRLSSTKSTRDAQVLVAGDRVLVADAQRVQCLSVAKGDLLWSFQPENRGIGGIHVDSGVCVVLTKDSGGRGGAAEIHAFDLVKGVELWQLGRIDGYYLPTMQVGSGRLVLFPVKTTTAAVHDLFTGYPLTALKTGRITSRQARPAWIDRGRLVVPFLDSGTNRELQNAIVAYDLEEGLEDWRIDLDNYRGKRRQLSGVIDMPDGEGGRTRIAMLEDANADRRASQEVSLHVIDEERGRFATGPRYFVDTSRRLYGVPNRRRVVLDAPVLLVAAESRTSDSTQFEALGPDLQPLWKVSSPRRVAVSGVRELPQPVHTTSQIALIVKEAFGSRANPGAEIKLMFLDAATGRHLETRRLETPGQKSGGWRTLEGFGETLIVAGSSQMNVLEAKTR